MLLEALDNEDQVTVETEWITVSLDENGALEEGDHVLRATSTDLTGNVSTMDITVHAVAKGEGYVGKIFRDESKIDFGLGGKILFASLIGLTALLAAAALLIPGRKKESEKQ